MLWVAVVATAIAETSQKVEIELADEVAAEADEDPEVVAGVIQKRTSQEVVQKGVRER